MIRKALGWLALVIALIWLLHNPHAAVDLVHHVITTLTTLADNL